jgi:hypothetical protein
MTGFASALKSPFGNIPSLEGHDHVKSIVLCYRFILGAKNHRFAITPKKGYIIKNWFLVVC